jgi:hypothetical protein
LVILALSPAIARFEHVFLERVYPRNCDEANDHAEAARDNAVPRVRVDAVAEPERQRKRKQPMLFQASSKKSSGSIATG